jgi:protein required for attachment to host cells
MSQSTLFTESKPGSGRTVGNETVHGYDDHRNEHEAETDRKFARLVTERGAEAAVERNCLQLIVASPSRMLGLIREHMDILNRYNIEVHMLAKNLTKLSAKQIHEHLAKESYIPPRRRPSSSGTTRASDLLSP